MMSAANEPSGRSPGFDPQAPHHQRPGQAQVLRYVAGTQWGNKKYMNMKHLEAALDDAFIAG